MMPYKPTGYTNNGKYLYSYPLYGTGSVLFNIHNETNTYETIKLENILIENAFWTAEYNYNLVVEPDNWIPSIMSTYLGDSSYQQIPKFVHIKDVHIKDLTLDGGWCHFHLVADTVLVEGLVMESIGKSLYTGDNYLIRYLTDVYRQSRNLNVPVSIIRVDLFDLPGGKLSNFTFKDCVFQNIDSINGSLPVFNIDKVYETNSTLKSTINFQNITFIDDAVDVDPTN